MSIDSMTENQLRQWFASGAIDQILTFCDALRSQRDRAEQKVLAYEHHIKILSARANEIIAPMLEKENLTSALSGCTKPFSRANYPEPKSKSAKSTKPTKSPKPTPASVNLSNLI